MQTNYNTHAAVASGHCVTLLKLLFQRFTVARNLHAWPGLNALVSRAYLAAPSDPTLVCGAGWRHGNSYRLRGIACPLGSGHGRLDNGT